MLADGTYEAIVVDADDDAPGAARIELALLAGPHKGELVTVTAHGLDRDSLDLLGVPATLTVLDGEPSVELDG